MRPLRRPLLLSSLLLLLGLSACAPSRETARAPEPVSTLPPIPAVEGPLEIDLAYPPPGALRPDVDSTFIFGSVGTGAARLTVNDIRVPVAPNGAFLAYLPVPEDRQYRLVARAGGARDTLLYTYRTPTPPQPQVTAFSPARLGVVTGGKDTLATGSEIVAGAPSPGADRRWFFPRGARLTVTGRLGDLYRVRLGEAEAWVDTAGVRLAEEAPPAMRPVDAVRLAPAPRYVDVVVEAGHAPFEIRAAGDTLGVTFFGRTVPAGAAEVDGDRLIESARWQPAGPATARLDLDLDAPVWGYKAFYTPEGDLVVRVRRPPEIDPEAPFEGIRVLVDAGHPPGGAIGPTGLTEAEANLAIALRLAEMLRARGAEVVLTRTSPEPLKSATSVATELWGRVDLAVAEDADLLVSIHNNAFPEGVNPFLHYGTETYYYHPFSEPLAQALVDEIAEVTGLPKLGAKQRSLALVRPSWMPSTLTESLFLMFPQQEAALRDPDFLDRLAAAHLRGLETFLRARALAE